MSDIVDFTVLEEKYTGKKPHEVSELICLRCFNRYIGVYPEKTLLKDLQCSKCLMKGFIIKTGQTILD